MPTDVELVRAALSCSVELPAGAGKTDLIARLVKSFADEGKRALVLTHTHAGVDVLRGRMRRYRVPSAAVRIRTLDSWCVDIIRSFPLTAGERIDDEPDWSRSEAYHQAGARAVNTIAIQRMLEATYDVLVVDEYQDCQVWQHNLVRAIAEVLPTCVLGDRMQGLFYFRNGDPVDWDEDVVPVFPAVEVPISPWRWAAANPELGRWLLEARQTLLTGQPLNLAGSPVEVYPRSQQAHVLFGRPRHPERTVAIARDWQTAPRLSQSLNGDYTMLEEIQGRHLRDFAQVVDSGRHAAIAAKTVDYAVECATGVAALFPTAARRRLADGQAIQTAPTDAAHHNALAAVNILLRDATPGRVRLALEALAGVQGFRLFRQESWRGVMDALRMAETTEALTVLEAVVRGRQRVSLEGRRPESRVVGRALLVKGLEFDHAVVLDPEQLNAHELYVCLTRGSKTVAVISDQVVFRPNRPTRSRRRA